MGVGKSAITSLADACGVPAGLPSAGAERAWSDLVHGFLSHGTQVAGAVGALPKLAPHCAAGHGVRGHILLLLARRELVPAAQEALDKARLTRRGDDPRENALIESLALWLDRHLVAATDRLDAYAADHPEDALILKLVHQMRFLVGDCLGMRRGMEAALPAYEGSTHPAAGYIHGCLAFALEESGDYAAAERAGRQAVALAPDDAWGLHAVAHVLEMTGRAEEGARWVRSQPQHYTHCGNFRFHVDWHLALFLLELGDVDGVLELYDSRVRAERTDDFRDVANGASLLMRLELHGVDVQDRWEELAEIGARRVGDGCLNFADLHYLMALYRANRQGEADALALRMVATCPDSSDCGSIAPAAAAAAGLSAFCRGDYAAAVAAWQEAGPGLVSVGGSHAQRDVFQQVAIESARRSGDVRLMRQMIQDRGQRRPAAKPDLFARSRLMPQQAAE